MRSKTIFCLYEKGGGLEKDRSSLMKEGGERRQPGMDEKTEKTDNQDSQAEKESLASEEAPPLPNGEEGEASETSETSEASERPAELSSEEEAGRLDAAAAAAAGKPSRKRLDKMTLRVDFRIGSVMLPLESLSRVAPGFTLTNLDGVLFPRVEALSGDRVFAEGELVEIDGRIGVRILSIAD